MKCGYCDGTGSADSGGFTPWGWPNEKEDVFIVPVQFEFGRVAYIITEAEGVACGIFQLEADEGNAVTWIVGPQYPGYNNGVSA